METSRIARLATLAAALFAGSEIGQPSERSRMWLLRRPGALCVLLTILGVANGLGRHGLQPILVKEKVERRHGGVIYEKWNSFSRVIATPPATLVPTLWGPSPHLPPGMVEQIWPSGMVVIPSRTSWQMR